MGQDGIICKFVFVASSKNKNFVRKKMSKPNEATAVIIVPPPNLFVSQMLSSSSSSTATVGGAVDIARRKDFAQHQMKIFVGRVTGMMNGCNPCNLGGGVWRREWQLSVVEWLNKVVQFETYRYAKMSGIEEINVSLDKDLAIVFSFHSFHGAVSSDLVSGRNRPQWEVWWSFEEEAKKVLFEKLDPHYVARFDELSGRQGGNVFLLSALRRLLKFESLPLNLWCAIFVELYAVFGLPAAHLQWESAIIRGGERRQIQPSTTGLTMSIADENQEQWVCVRRQHYFPQLRFHEPTSFRYDNDEIDDVDCDDEDDDDENEWIWFRQKLLVPTFRLLPHVRESALRKLPNWRRLFMEDFVESLYCAQIMWVIDSTWSSGTLEHTMAQELVKHCRFSKYLKSVYGENTLTIGSLRATPFRTLEPKNRETETIKEHQDFILLSLITKPHTNNNSNVENDEVELDDEGDNEKFKVNDNEEAVEENEIENLEENLKSNTNLSTMKTMARLRRICLVLTLKEVALLVRWMIYCYSENIHVLEGLSKTNTTNSSSDASGTINFPTLNDDFSDPLRIRGLFADTFVPRSFTEYRQLAFLLHTFSFENYNQFPLPRALIDLSFSYLSPTPTRSRYPKHALQPAQYYV